jgi:hypothetical protein
LALGHILGQAVEELRERPLRRSLVKLPNLTDETVDVGNEQVMTFGFDALHRIRRPQADHGIIALVAVEQFVKSIWIRKDEIDNFDRSSERVGMSSRQHLFERFSHEQPYHSPDDQIQSGLVSRGKPSHLFGRFEGALNRFNFVAEKMIAE